MHGASPIPPQINIVCVYSALAVDVVDSEVQYTQYEKQLLDVLRELDLVYRCFLQLLD